MNKFLCTAFAIVAASPLAHAEDFYVGASLGRPMDGHVKWRENGVTTERDADRKAIPPELFAGYVLSPNWALEGGYRGSMGSTTFNVAPGYQLRARASAAYVATRGTWLLNDDWSLFGKVGVARGRAKFSIDGGGAAVRESTRKTGAYLSVGASYLLAKDVAVQLELEHTDTLKYEGLTATMNRLSLGLRLGF